MEQKCIKCGEKAVEKLITQVQGKVVKEENFCAKHWVEDEGESCIRNGLEFAKRNKIYKSIHPEVAKEIWKQHPKLAQEFARIIRKNFKENN